MPAWAGRLGLGCRFRVACFQEPVPEPRRYPMREAGLDPLPARQRRIGLADLGPGRGMARCRQYMVGAARKRPSPSDRGAPAVDSSPGTSHESDVRQDNAGYDRGSKSGGEDAEPHQAMAVEMLRCAAIRSTLESLGATNRHRQSHTLRNHAKSKSRETRSRDNAIHARCIGAGA